MAHNHILLTGASGYLGGSILNAWNGARLPPHGRLFSLVRSDSQAAAVRNHGAEPVRFDVTKAEEIRAFVIQHNVTIVIWLIDAVRPVSQLVFIEALAEVQKKTGCETHFIHTSGAKIFSSHAGAPRHAFADTAATLFNIQKAQISPLPPVQNAITTNNLIIERGGVHGVRTYIFVLPIVYGRSQGFGNPISIQTTAIVRAARAHRQVYSVDDGDPMWPICHVDDCTGLYMQLLRRILDGSKPPSGKSGYYLASSGSIAWKALYVAIARALASRGEIAGDGIKRADSDALEGMAHALGCPKEFVPLQLGGHCAFIAAQGANIGWKPSHKPVHALESADEEVRLILQALDRGSSTSL